jgi:competence protein ComEC
MSQWWRFDAVQNSRIQIERYMQAVFHPLLYFWLYHPALLYGIAFLLGLYCRLEGSIWLIIPCLCLWLPFALIAACAKQYDALKHLALSLLTFFTAWIYAASHVTFPTLPQQGVIGKAHIKIKNISLQPSLFGERWLYRCEIEQFFPDNTAHSLASSLPCLVILPAAQLQRHPRPLANQEYWVSGKLMQTTKGAYLLKVSAKTTWIAISGSRSWAEQRYQWKKKFSEWIESQFSYPLSGSFLAGLATGEFDDYWMRQQFARFGLQHLLAISGFHFAIIAGFLSFVLRLFLPQRMRIISLLICLGAYCFFLGPQASILRAWILCSLTLLGELLEKQTTALNSLGLALLGILGYNPLLCQELGFQLSFATTAAILLFYPPAQAWLYDLFPKRQLSEVMQMNSWSQHGYCVLAFLRQGLALTLAINVFALPLTLYCFQQFPWMSLLYNLFYPLLASGSLCLLLLGILLSFVPFIAIALHGLNDIYTFFVLQMTYQIPSEMDAYLKIDSLHSAWLIAYLCFASLGGIIWRMMSTKSDRSKDFNFI